MNEQKTNFVRIDITERQFITKKKDSDEFLYVSKNGVPFGKIICPGNGSIWYPIKNMFEYNNKTVKSHDGQTLKMYHFDQPSGTEFQIHYSNGTDQEDMVKTVTIDDLKEIFDQAKREFAKENSTFVNMEVPTSWDRTPEDPQYVRLSIPIEKDEEKKYYTFLLNRDKNWHESKKHEGYSYFGFPRMKKDSDEAWMVKLRGDEKQDDGTYVHPEISLSSAELKEYVDAAVKTNVTSHLSNSHSLMENFSETKKNEEVTDEETEENSFEQSQSNDNQEVSQPEAEMEEEEDAAFRLRRSR